MNTKTMKFLAVVAVLAFAFAAFAVAIPAQENEATTDPNWNAGEGKVAGTTSTILEGVTSITDSNKIYYYLEDTSVSIPSGKTGLVFFVKVGATVTISASGAAPYADSVVAVIPVSSVTVSGTNVTVQQAASANYLTTAPATTWTDQQHDTIYTLLAIHVNEVYKMKASSTGMIVLAGDNDGDYYGKSFTLEGAVGTVNLKGSEQNVTYINFTGKVIAGTTELILTKFTGEINLASAAFTIAKWDAGDVEVSKAETTGKVLLKSNIFEGSTLYVDAGQFAATDGNSYYNGAATATDKFVNSGTISIKQGTSGQSTNTSTIYGTFTLAGADMKNKGTINNLGVFTSTQKIENTGKIVTGDDIDESSSSPASTGMQFTAGVITNDGSFTFKETTVASGLKFSTASTGEIRNQVTSNKNIEGIITTDTYGYNQSATIIGNSTLTGVLTLNGVLIIEEGVTLTITDAGSIVMGCPQSVIINNGTIEVQNAVTGGTIKNTAGFIANNGIIVLSDPTAEPTVPTLTMGGTGDVTAAFLKNFGTITNSAGIMDLAATGVLLNMAGASFVNEGELKTAEGTTVKNAGYIGINGKVTAAAALTITETNKAAIFEVIEMKLATSAITIANGVGSKVGSIEFPITESGTNIITGLKVSTYNVPNEETGKADYGYFILSGNASYFTANYSIPESTVTYIVKMSGTKAFIGDLVLNEQVRISGNSNHLYFVGTAMMVDSGAATIGGSPEITVTGEVITSRAPLSGYADGKLNAAMYTVTNDSYVKTYYYTTLANAISEAALIGADKGEVTATGTTKVSEDLTIPAPIKLKNQGKIMIDDGADVTIEDGASINNSGTITVNGSLYAAVAKTGITGSTTDTSIISDVKVVGEPDVLYTNLYDALATAEAGDVVVITKNDGKPVILTKDTTIPLGVTLDTNEKALQTYKQATAPSTEDTHYKLIVNGTLVLYAAADFKAYSDITLNGYIVSDDKRTYSTTGLAGAYFETEIDNVELYYIAGVKNLGDILAAGIDTVDVWGDVKTTSLAFEGTAANAKVTFNNNVDVDAIVADNVKIVFKAGDVIDTAITEGENILGLTGIVSATEDMTVTIGDSFAVAGDLGTGADVSAKDFVFNIVGAIKVSGSVYAAVIVGEATTAGNFEVTTTIDILGSLVASKAVTANDMSVIGTVSTTGDDGKVTIANGLNIGSLTEIIAAGADVEGAVTAEKIILFVGNTIDEKIVAEMKSTEVYVDGDLWFTVYSNSAVEISEDAELVVPVEDALAVEGTYEGLEVDKNGILSGEITPGTPAEIDIDVKYDIYDVVILTDAGVKSVSIDGIELWNSGTNRFTLPGDILLMAGTHTVTYTMKAGYSGTPTLKTVDGTILKDYKFVTSGTEDLTVDLQLNGTEPTPEPEPTPTPEEKSEWTITTILLVILVILIAVMAVIVALRLNRN